MSEFKLKQTAEEVQKAIDDASIPSDWNQNDETAADFIKNKPFGELPTGSDTLTIPAYSEEELMAKIESGEAVFVDALGAVKMSDAIVTMADLSNGCMFASDYLGAFDIPAEEIAYVVDGVIMVAENLAFFVDESAVGVDNDGIVFPEPGVYFTAELLLADSALTIPGYTGFPATKKIDKKYLHSARPVVYYYGIGAKLYKTPALSDGAEVTKDEFNAAYFENGVLISKGMNTYTTPIYVAPDMNAYATVTFIENMDSGSPTYLTRYTAEYTES